MISKQGQVEHTVTIDGHTYRFKWEGDVAGNAGICTAPGVVKFRASSLSGARDILWSLYSRKAQ